MRMSRPDRESESAELERELEAYRSEAPLSFVHMLARRCGAPRIRESRWFQPRARYGLVALLGSAVLAAAASAGVLSVARDSVHNAFSAVSSLADDHHSSFQGGFNQGNNSGRGPSFGQGGNSGQGNQGGQGGNQGGQGGKQGGQGGNFGQTTDQTTTQETTTEETTTEETTTQQTTTQEITTPGDPGQRGNQGQGGNSNQGGNSGYGDPGQGNGQGNNGYGDPGDPYRHHHYPGFPGPPGFHQYSNYCGRPPHAQCVVQITPDDPEIEETNSSIPDGVQLTGPSHDGSTTITFTITLSAPSDGSVRIDYSTADGSATAANGDYDPASGTVEFPFGATSETVTITVNLDDRPGPDKDFFVNFSSESISAVLGPDDSQKTVTIDNDITAPPPPPPPPPPRHRHHRFPTRSFRRDHHGHH